MKQISSSKNTEYPVGTVVFFLTVLMLAAACLLSGPSAGNAWAAEALQSAPLNPDFENYLIKKASQGVEASAPTTYDGRSLGFVPPPVRIPAPAGSKTASLATSFPTKFDLRTSTPVGVTPVRDQRQCGSCWTFGTMASLESYLKFKQAKTQDFSEEDLNENHGFDFPVCSGGNHFMSAAYMTRWGGPVTEANVPYPYWITETGLSPQATSAVAPAVEATPGVSTAYHVQNIYFLPQTAKPLTSTDIATLKTALQANGAVSVSYYVAPNNTYYNATNHSYYCNASGMTPNHMVAIVGWDDGYLSTKFTPAAPGNGAFIVKNSWGTGWGELGYFYMSYYDKSLELDAQLDNAQPVTTYTRVYQYDPLGWVTSLGYSSGTLTMGWYANIFMASENAAHVTGVGTYTPVANASYTLYVRSNVTPGKPMSGTAVATKTGTIAKPGYNTIPVPSAAIAANKPFSVVIKMTTPGYNWPIPVEYAYPGYSSAASSCPGQSFVSHDGTNWSDMSSDPDPANNANVCLKALAVQ